MKKIFTLAAAALCSASMYAQDVYDAIVDGNLAPEFAAVSSQTGGSANNVVDGKSIVEMKAGKATVTAVGGTTPANDTEIGGGAQQVVPGAVIDAEKHIYEVAGVKAWNDVSWGKGNQGDIDFSYVTGSGNPYVKMNAVQNSKDGVWIDNSYKADYVFYEPDGSAGMPITGLYYKFTATAKGAFKVKVWANKGNRKTFVVNAKDMKAQRLYASGYINGVNDESGKKKLLTVEQVDSVHHVYIYGAYEQAVEAGTKTAEELEQMKAEADALAIEREYVIGNGGQNFWGWLTFDIEAGEEYWVFQHSSQIGFGGFEFHEGMSAEELIQGIEGPYVYTTNFSTYEDENTGERKTWKGETIVGTGMFVSTDEEGEPFGDYFQNEPGTAPRQNYCLLPSDVFAHSAKTEALSFGVWVKAPEGWDSDTYAWTPLLTAYGQNTNGGDNSWPMFAAQYRGLLQVNCAGYTDYVAEQNVAGANTEYNFANDWLADNKWHYYTCVLEGENAKVYFDGELKNEWDNTKVADRTQKGLFSNGAELTHVCLGGNQAWNWADLDSPFCFARLLIKNSSMTQGEIKAQMALDFPGYEDYLGVSAIETVKVVNAPKGNGMIYNLAGQRVSESYKGIVIKDGKKVMR